MSGAPCHASGEFFVFASFGLVLGGDIILVAATVSVCAAAAVISMAWRCEPLSEN